MMKKHPRESKRLEVANTKNQSGDDPVKATHIASPGHTAEESMETEQLIRSEQQQQPQTVSSIGKILYKSHEIIQMYSYSNI